MQYSIIIQKTHLSLLVLTAEVSHSDKIKLKIYNMENTHLNITI